MQLRSQYLKIFAKIFANAIPLSALSRRLNVRGNTGDAAQRVRQSSIGYDECAARDQGLPKFALTCRRRPASKSRRFLRGPEKNREWYAGNRNAPARRTPRSVPRDKISSSRGSAFFRRTDDRAPVKRFAAPPCFSVVSWDVRSTREIGADSADFSCVSHAREYRPLVSSWSVQSIDPAKISRFAHAIRPVMLFRKHWPAAQEWWVIISMMKSATRLSNKLLKIGNTIIEIKTTRAIINACNFPANTNIAAIMTVVIIFYFILWICTKTEAQYNRQNLYNNIHITKKRKILHKKKICINE